MIVSFANAMKKENKTIDFENVLCMIGGTSTCAMVLSKDKILSRKVWGPYWLVFNFVYPFNQQNRLYITKSILIL